MKKALFILPAFALVVLAGCDKPADKMNLETGSTPAAPASVQMMQDGKTAQEVAVETIDTTVAPITADTNTDEVLEDIDALMAELDAL